MRFFLISLPCRWFRPLPGAVLSPSARKYPKKPPQGETRAPARDGVPLENPPSPFFWGRGVWFGAPQIASPPPVGTSHPDGPMADECHRVTKEPGGVRRAYVCRCGGGRGFCVGGGLPDDPKLVCEECYSDGTFFRALSTGSRLPVPAGDGTFFFGKKVPKEADLRGKRKLPLATRTP